MPLYKTQGRVIVHQDLRNEIIFETSPLVQGAFFSKDGNLVHSGSFDSLSNSLDVYKRTNNITLLYLIGVSETKTKNSYLFSPVDKTTPSKFFGGEKSFNKLLEKAKNLGLKIVIDHSSCVSSSGYHRKYKNLFVNLGENEGRHQGTDGYEQKYGKETSLLNYRKKETW